MIRAITRPEGRRPSIGVVGVAAVALLVYWVLLGGTEAGHVLAPFRTLNAALGGILIWFWIRTMPSERDRIDEIALLGLCAFLVAAALSQFPRASLDAAVSVMAWVAALYHARRLARLREFREFTLTILGIAGASLALVMAFLWAAVWMRWLELVDFGSAPPLTINMPLLVFRHMHVVAFTVVLLQPAVLSLWRSPLLRPVVVLSLAATLMVTFASGSRTAWVSAVLASGLVLVDRMARGRWRTPSRPVLAVAALALGGAAVGGWAAGLATPFIERMANLQTLGARGEIWAAALSAFQQDPLTGSGPGTFVMALPLSDYFTFNAFTPRHADNAMIQLLSEGGLIASAGVVLAVIWAGVRWGRQPGSLRALWAIGFFAFACLTDNPSDTAGLNALLLVWVAFALPREVVPATSMRPSPAWTAMRAVHIGAFALVCTALFATSLGHFIRDDAARKAGLGDTLGALDAMRAAVIVDLGNPLYQRELGLLELVAGNAPAARDTLRAASALAPTDDVTLRSLAVAESMAGGHAAAMSAAAKAAELRPSDPMNLLLQAALAIDTDPGSVAYASVLHALQQDPLLAAAPSWKEHMGRMGERAELLGRAHRAVGTPDATRVKLTSQRMWLRSAAGAGPATRLEEAAAREADALLMSKAWALLMDCRIAQADRAIRSAQKTEGESPFYWFARAVIATAAGSDAERPRQIAVLMNPSFVAYTLDPQPNNPLMDPAADRRWYGRLPMPIQLDFLQLPSGGEARAAWWQDPFAAAAAGAPASKLAGCRTEPTATRGS